MESKIKRTIAILLAVCFLVSITATAVSASSKDYKDGCKAGYKAGYDAGYATGNEKGYADGYADGSKTVREIATKSGHRSFGGLPKSFNSEDYRKGYKACYTKGNEQGNEDGYKKGYDEGFKDGVNA